ncbi:MAG: Coenzyme F420 hydrogenase/dehydrogenase, beta subunit C-terminal domain, partial [Bacteroidales bacterium]|nr:Coenzyme F420 hydrogenase/dehydrogenase, beta subunit C-terminal domain [Bacteroidales bacterium]
IQYTLKNDICTGCGICEDVCPTKSIDMIRVNGEIHPKLNKITCIGDKCGRCLKVCPGVGMDLDEDYNLVTQTEVKFEDKYIGKYKGLYTGYSLDQNIRYHGASGGLLSQFLIYLLEKKIVDGVAVTGFSELDKITPISYIARTKEEVLKAKGSKYCPVALNKIGNEIKQSDGKYIIVGLPCHIEGFRKREKIDPKFKEKILGYFALYCSSNRSFKAQDYIFRNLKIRKKEIEYFAYRDRGCLGNMIIETPKKENEIPYSKYYRLLRSFFKPQRCLMCIDHYGKLADVSFGDIHIKPYSEDHIGISSCITKSKEFDQLLLNAQKEGYLHLDPVKPSVLNASQAQMLYPRSRKVKAKMKIHSLLGKKTPKFDCKYDNPKIKDYVSVILTDIQRFIGRHKNFWFLIDLSNNKGIR